VERSRRARRAADAHVGGLGLPGRGLGCGREAADRVLSRLGPVLAGLLAAAGVAHAEAYQAPATCCGVDVAARWRCDGAGDRRL